MGKSKGVVREAKFKTVRQITETYSIGATSVYEHLNNGAFAAIKVGRRTLVEMGSFEQWLAAQPRWRAAKLR